MEVLSISGGRPLNGSVNIGGSKNSALSLLAAATLAEGEIVFQNVPNISDTRQKAQMLESFGAKVRWEGESLAVDATHLHMNDVDEEAARSIRTSFFLLGPLLARMGRVRLPAPGGCKIGARPVDLHIKGLTALGAKIDFSGGIYTASADRLRGAEIYLDVASPGATQHLMATATYAEGPTTILNAAMEPEVSTLADFLCCLGAKIEGAGTSTITIHGGRPLSGCNFRVPADRMQAGTYLVAAAVTGGDVTACGLLPEHQVPIVNKLIEAGAYVEEGHDWIRVQAPKRLSAIQVRTMPYPGFPTDMQQPMCAMMASSLGTSLIEETIYESRIGHVQELNRMGARIQLQGRTTIVQGVDRLQGATVEASDLRAGAALVLAGLGADGDTIVKNIHYIDRGYERLEENLRSLGAKIDRVYHHESGSPHKAESTL